MNTIKVHNNHSCQRKNIGKEIVRILLIILEVYFTFFIVGVTTFSTINLYYHEHINRLFYVRHPIAFQLYLGAIMSLILSILLITTLWNKTKTFTKYALLVLGTLSILTFPTISMVYLITPFESMYEYAIKDNISISFSLLPYIGIPLIGVSCLVRQYLLSKYNSNSYIVGLVRSYKDKPSSFVKLLLFLIFYLSFILSYIEYVLNTI